MNLLLTTQAKDVMTKQVICVYPKMGLKELSAMFIEHRISGAPVIEEDGTLIGFVSQTDVVEMELHSDDFLESRMEETGGFVVDIMAPDVGALPETATLASVLDAMCAERRHRVVIVDVEQHVSGMITTLDVLSYLRPMLESL